ncbi:MAG: regulatory protein RecX [Desulfotignum sp.]|nr:regulatory protein RecX [Desulfotignum sp.]
MPLFADTPDPEEERLFQAALRYLAVRPRSVREMTQYLAKKKPDKAVINRIIDRLNRYKYLDDEVFARIFIDNRKRHTPKSRFALTHELKQKGISTRIISDLLNDYDDVQMACLALEKKIRQWHHLDQATRRKKAVNFLRYRGFGYEAVQSAWEQVSKGPDPENDGYGPLTF